MMSSALNVPNPAIPMPDFEVPSAAPMASLPAYPQCLSHAKVYERPTAKYHLKAYIHVSTKMSSGDEQYKPPRIHLQIQRRGNTEDINLP
jgi:hypothetical protein